MSSSKTEIYKAHVQSADKIDERRDITVRTYGAACVAITAMAFGLVIEYPTLALGLFMALIVLGVLWVGLLGSLTAKLIAKSNLLRAIEQEGEVPLQFLTRERKEWESLDTPPLQTVIKRAPKAFIWIGAIGILLVAYCQLCQCTEPKGMLL